MTRNQERGGEQRPKPHEHCPLVSLTLTWSRYVLLVAKNCHGRGRGFESRRPRHHSQSTYGMVARKSRSTIRSTQHHCTAPEVMSASRTCPWAARASSLSSCVQRSSVV